MSGFRDTIASIESESVQEPGGMEVDGRAFYEEEPDDEDKTDDGDDDEEENEKQDSTQIRVKPQMINGIPIRQAAQTTSQGPKSITSISTFERGSHEADVNAAKQSLQLQGSMQHKIMLSDEEKELAKNAFKVWSQQSTLTRDHFEHALASLGYVCDRKRVIELYSSEATGNDTLGELGFLKILSNMRSESDSDRNSKIEEAFEALFSGTCKDTDRQRDTQGRKFILVKDLRYVLTTYGDRLSDEEADELVRECRPEQGDDGDQTEEGERRIFFEQYRAMLLDSAL